MSNKVSKRMQKVRSLIEVGKVYSAVEAFKLLAEASSVKFSESIDIAIALGIDTRKSDQTVRGAVVLPHGTGRSVRVAAFVEAEHEKTAKEAGADIVGSETLAESIKAGNLDFDVLIATPGSMRLVGQLGQILGPRGLMPNPKVGTVTPDVATAIKNAKAGQVQFRADKAGFVHCRIGNVKFEPKALKENLVALLAELRKLKPATSKGVYLKKVTASTTMGPGVLIDLAELG